ncbi:uncharacterized protein TrAFT101_002458 [Trichoderma asperellum]|uniref:uncharacterized protein n=1 Tax=Trichoderma asperellum TaxID=101201 RepID=UPI00331EB431|nr:hypothetical protein TrAFT101_002458 [Trichoderma asperellum]
MFRDEKGVPNEHDRRSFTTISTASARRLAAILPTPYDRVGEALQISGGPYSSSLQNSAANVGPKANILCKNPHMSNINDVARIWRVTERVLGKPSSGGGGGSGGGSGGGRGGRGNGRIGGCGGGGGSGRGVTRGLRGGGGHGSSLPPPEQQQQQPQQEFLQQLGLLLQQQQLQQQPGGKEGKVEETELVKNKKD